MAEGLARHIVSSRCGDVAIFSAGSTPSVVNPYAVQAMREVGIDLASHSSKSVDSIPVDQIDTVITLCDEEICPLFQHPVERHHWPHADPAAAEGSTEDILQSFRNTRDELHTRLKQFLS